MHAVLESRLDARRAQVGDTVKARASRAVKSGESVLLPRGSKLLGRINLVDANARGESKLGISFDRALLPDGTELAVDLAIQAIAAAEVDESAPRVRASHATDVYETEMSSSRGTRGGLLGTADDLLLDTPELSGSIASDVEIGGDAGLGRSIQTNGTLSSSSVGVIGLNGLELESTGKSSVLVRASGPVTVASGTRLLLRSKGEVSAH